jgi:hypothetical protein
MTLKIQRILTGFAVVMMAATILFTGCGGGSPSTTTDSSPSTSTNGGSATTSSGNGIDKANGPAIGISPSVITVNQGDEFDVQVMAKMPDPITGAGCQLKWAGTGSIECVDKIEAGSYMIDNIGSVDDRGNFEADPDSKDKPLMVGGNYDAMIGTTGQVALTVTGEDRAVEGDGVILVFHFKAVEKGEVTLELFDIQVTDLNFMEISNVQSFNGKVVIE